jgi:carboxyl-terminal processing protease
MTRRKRKPMSPSQSERKRILRSIKTRVLKQHINIAGVSYEAWTRLVDERTSELLTADADQFESGIRRLLSELGTSHTVFYHEHPSQLLPQHSINASLRRFEQAGAARWIFLDVFEDGPAHAAGIKPGDVLLAVDGTSYVPPSMPPFKIGRTCRLKVSSIQGDNIREVPIEVPNRKGTKSRPPIVEPKSLAHRMIASNIGLLKIVYFPGEQGVRFSETLDNAIRALKEQGCEHLIIDLRGNIGGGLGFARLASYLCPGQIPIGHSLTPGRLRRGYDRDELPRVPMPRTRVAVALTLARFAFQDKSLVLLTQGLGPQPFHGNVAILVNEWTNSAAEMVAGFAADHRLATIVGSKTAGNVLGAANFRVGSGYWLRLPVFGWYTSQGDCLEGKGVSPDVVVDVDPVLLNAGVDRQMERALEVLRGVRQDSSRAARA